MRVTLLSHFAGRGGSTSFLSQVRKLLDNAGHDTSVVVGKGPATEAVPDAIICPDARHWKERMEKYLALVRRTNPDLVYSISGMEEWELLRFIDRPRLRHIFSVEQHDYMDIPRVARLLGGNVEVLTANTPDIFDCLHPYISKFNTRHVCLPYAINGNFTMLDPPTPHCGEFVSVCFVGRLDQTQKRAHWIPQIIERCAEIGLPISWNIFGDGPLKTAMQSYLSELRGKTVRVNFYGWLDARDLAYRLVSNDVFFLCSQWEGMPIAMAEAMFAGVACLVPDVRGGMGYALRNGGGWLYKADSPAHCVTALTQIVKDRDRLELKRREAYMGAKETFVQDHNYKESFAEFLSTIQTVTHNGAVDTIGNANMTQPVSIFRRAVRLSRRTLRLYENGTPTCSAL